MNELAKWIIVGIAIAGLMFNTGVLFNDVKHLKESQKKLWEQLDQIKNILIRMGK